MWPKGKDQILATSYGGAKSAVEALKKTIASKTQAQEEAAAQVSQRTLAAKLKEVMAVIEKKSDGIDTDLIPKEVRDQLAEMPLTSVEEVRLWGFSWLEQIKKLEPVRRG